MTTFFEHVEKHLSLLDTGAYLTGDELMNVCQWQDDGDTALEIARRIFSRREYEQANESGERTY